MLISCAAEQNTTDPTSIATSAVADDTGIDAEESAEPITRLVLVEPETGAVVVFDASTETATPLGEFGPVQGISGDGRFGYLRGNTALTIIDAGSWTYDHGDHSHYYAEPPAVAGSIDGRILGAHGQRTLTTVRHADGTVDVLDRDALGQHRIGPAEGFGDLPDAVATAPLGDSVLAVTRDGVVTEIGTDTRVLGRCPGVTGAATVGREVVFGCADKAVRIVKRSGEVTAEHIPFAGRLGPLAHRYGSSVLTAVGDNEVAVLDARRGVWSSVSVTDPIAANSASGDSVMVLTADGNLRAFHTADNRETAVVQLFEGPVPTQLPAPVIEVDSDRAYVNDVQRGAVYEIDYRDGLRVARTFDTDVAPGFMVEVGR